MKPNTFTSSRLDYCNQLFVGVTGRMPDKPILEHCCSPGHWNQKIWPHYTCDVKTLLATSPSVDQVQDSCSGLRVPSWTSFGMSEYCKLMTGRSHLWSANACLLSVSHTWTTYYDDSSFAISGPVVWNNLWHCDQVTSRRRLSKNI